MKTKTIPFDLETAKKIQAGEIKGKIFCVRREVIILDYNSKKHSDYPIRIAFLDKDEIDYAAQEGLCIEVPNNEPEKPQFKPFDKVLVRRPYKTELCVSEDIWLPGIFQYKSVNTSLYFVSGKAYWDCIPYEGNEYLVGTNDKPNEK